MSEKMDIIEAIHSDLACFKDWQPYLGPGERVWIFVISVDRSQAQIVKNYIGGILSSAPVFRRMVKKELRDEIHLKNGVNIAIKTSDFRSIRGYSIACCVAEEVSFWRDSETSANPSEEILRALRPALATIPDSLLLGISTPYCKSGVLWNQYRSHYGKSGGPLIWKAPTELMNPTLDRKIIKDALKDDPVGARAEWQAEFREDTQALLPPELVDDCIIPGRFELPVMRDTTYHGFTDPSAGRQDSFTLAIAHHDQDIGKVILDVIREARPPFRPEEVVRDFSEVLKKYGVYQIESDKFAGEWNSDAFRRNGIHLENAKKTKSEFYIEFLPLISNRSVELLDHKRLRSQLCALERRSRSGGRDQVDNFFGHDDLSNAAAGACGLASQISSYRLPPPSLGLIEPEFGSEKQKMDMEATRWLLGLPKKKKKKPDEIDMGELEDELHAWEEEFERERVKNTDEKNDLVFIKKGW